MVNPSDLEVRHVGLAGIITLYLGGVNSCLQTLPANLLIGLVLGCFRDDTKAKSNGNALHLLAVIDLLGKR